jgi:hypothetical protein
MSEQMSLTEAMNKMAVNQEKERRYLREQNRELLLLVHALIDRQQGVTETEPETTPKKTLRQKIFGG